MVISREYLILLILGIPGALLAISMHEAAHGYAAYLMGDRTAKYQGRLSLNPFRHLDLVGTICMFLFHFGWAKPVLINPQSFKKRRLGVIVVSLAGPFTNFLLGLISAILAGVVMSIAKSPEYATYVYSRYISPMHILNIDTSPGADFLSIILQLSMIKNVALMLFNLIPFPPLDGSKVLIEFLPPRAKMFAYRYERYAGLVLMIVVCLGVLTVPLYYGMEYVIKFYSLICEGIFGLFI